MHTIGFPAIAVANFHWSSANPTYAEIGFARDSISAVGCVRRWAIDGGEAGLGRGLEMELTDSSGIRYLVKRMATFWDDMGLFARQTKAETKGLKADRAVFLVLSHVAR